MAAQRLCTFYQQIDLKALRPASGFKHYPTSKYMRDSKDGLNDCDLCRLIWWSLRHSHDKVRHGFLSPEIRLYRRKDMVWAIAADPVDFLDAVPSSRGIWFFENPERIFVGELLVYGIRGKRLRIPTLSLLVIYANRKEVQVT